MSEIEKQSSLLRVLIVDDSALYRQTISTVLREVKNIEVVGIAKDGEEAISQIEKLAPDLLTLDVEMPIMNGIDTLREMNRKKLSAGAIMVSSLTLAGAQVTLDALFEGAFDFITKPTGGLVDSRKALAQALREKIRAYRQFRRDSQLKPDHAAARQPIAVPSPRDTVKTSLEDHSANGSFRSETTAASAKHCDAVIIGASTGGPKALRFVLPRIDVEFPIPLIVVQHMPAAYTSMMAHRLNEECELEAVEAIDGMKISAGRIYIAPGGRHLRLMRRSDSVVVKLTDDPPQNSCRPSVDFTLESAVDVYGGNLLSVIMTGMGKDGQKGCQRLKQLGGTVFTQDAASSAVYGMPKAVVDAGLSDRSLPLGRIGPAITRHANRHRASC